MRLLIVAAKCVAAGALIVVGTILIPLPGPGTPLIIAGLAVLSTEFEWAAQLRQRLEDFLRRVVQSAIGAFSSARA